MIFYNNQKFLLYNLTARNEDKKNKNKVALESKLIYYSNKIIENIIYLKMSYTTIHSLL